VSWEASSIFEPAQAEEDQTRFRNFYVHCRYELQDEWSCMCNDRYPVCDREIEPYASGEKGDEELELHVRADWMPDQGLRLGIENVEDLAGWQSKGVRSEHAGFGRVEQPSSRAELHAPKINTCRRP
jgi:hypothetical protein